MDDPIAARYARRIRAARAMLSLSQPEFAQLVGDVTERTVRAWEKGKNAPQTQYRGRLQQIFDQLDAEEEEQRKVSAV